MLALLTGRRVLLDLLPVRSRSGFDTFCLPWTAARQRSYHSCESSKNSLFSKLCVHKQCSQCSCSCVETLVMLPAKFHVVSSLLTVLKIEILMLAWQCPCTPLKISLPENETRANLKSASFIVIMHLHKGLTHIQSQIKPWLLFGESFTLMSDIMDTVVADSLSLHLHLKLNLD